MVPIFGKGAHNMTHESESPKPGIHMMRRVLPWIPKATAASFLTMAVISGVGFSKQHSELEHCNTASSQYIV